MTAVRLEEVTRDFGGVRAVDAVTLGVEPGEIVGLVGANGSGKTTVVNLVTGSVAPSSGRVLVGDVDLTGAHSVRYARAGVVRTFQSLRLFEAMSVLDNVLIGAQRQRRPTLAEAWARPPRFRRRERSLRAAATGALDQLGLAALAGRPVAELSQGQRRRVELARALAAQPSCLVLDEPAAGVDPAQMDRLIAAVTGARDAGCGVLLVEHDVALVVGLADRVIGMAGGAIVSEGTFAAVSAHPDLAPHLSRPGSP